MKEIIKFGSYFTWKDNKGNYNTQCNRACDLNGCSLTIPTIPGLTKVLIEKDTSKIIREEPLNRPGWRRYNQEILNVEGVGRTLLAQSNNELTKIKEPTTLRIRKLTPLECWRLMGFTDEEFYKARDAGISNTQLYKQAGNSIVVNVLTNIFKELLKGEIKEDEEV